VSFAISILISTWELLLSGAERGPVRSVLEDSLENAKGPSLPVYNRQSASAASLSFQSPCLAAKGLSCSVPFVGPSALLETLLVRSQPNFRLASGISTQQWWRAPKTHFRRWVLYV